MIKNTDEQLDEEIYRSRSGRVPSTEASVPMQLVYVTLPGVYVFTHSETLQTPYY